MLRLNTFIIQASIAIITYNRQNIFIVQATGVNFINLFTCSFSMPMTKKVKCHFTKHFCTKNGEVYAEKFGATCEASIC
jgi:hypothetical protein